MRFLTISSKMCVSAAVFYSTFLLSKCRANDIPELVWLDDKVVYIYRTAIPWTPIEIKESKNKVAVSTIIWVAVGIAFVMYLCCVFCKFCHILNSRRHSANTSLIPSDPEAIVVFQTDTSAAAHGQIRNSNTRNDNFGNGVVNFAFTGNRQDMPPDDGPPEYSAVISQTSPNHMPENNAPSPQVSGTKAGETPPPAYISVAPFQ